MRLCWPHIPHCWKSYVAAHFCFYVQVRSQNAGRLVASSVSHQLRPFSNNGKFLFKERICSKMERIHFFKCSPYGLKNSQIFKLFTIIVFVARVRDCVLGATSLAHYESN